MQSKWRSEIKQHIAINSCDGRELLVFACLLQHKHIYKKDIYGLWSWISSVHSFWSTTMLWELIYFITLVYLFYNSVWKSLIIHIVIDEMAAWFFETFTVCHTCSSPQVVMSRWLHFNLKNNLVSLYVLLIVQKESTEDVTCMKCVCKMQTKH